MKNWSQIWRKIYYFPNKPPTKLAQDENAEKPVELDSQERRAKFRRALTNKVSAGWHLEIENEFDAVMSKKSGFNWVGSLILFVILLWLVAPLAIFYLIALVIAKINAKPKTVKIWIDAFGNIKTNN